MKKTRILLAIGLILAVATPALAEVKFSGFYRLMGISGELKDVDTQQNDSQQLIDQRFRAQITNTLNDNVSITYQAEIDTVWGASVPAGGGNGGAFDTDGVNVETKHIYLDLKQGDTSARLGLQTYGDEFQGLVGFADMAGVTVKHKIGNTSIGLLYSKWDENDGDGNDLDVDADGVLSDDNNINGPYSDWDDTDFYGVTVQQKISDAFKLGGAVYYLNSNDVTDVRANIATGLSGMDRTAYADHADGEVWFYGVTADAKFGDFGVDGFVLYQRGSVDYHERTDLDHNERAAAGVGTKADQSSQAWAASVKGTLKLANGNVGLRGIFITDDESNDDNEYWLGSFGEYDFVNENQMIFLTDKFVCNYTKERYAMNDAARQGYGLWALVLSGNHTLPNDMYANWGLGYYSAQDNERNDQMTGVKGNPRTWQNVRTNGKQLGWEADLRVGKKFFEKVDVSLNMAYADFGSFYNDTTEENNHNLPNGNTRGSNSPDSIYKTYLMVNVPF